MKQTISIAIIWMFLMLPIVEAQSLNTTSTNVSNATSSPPATSALSTIIITNATLDFSPTTTLISWLTNQNATSYVEYGTTPAMGITVNKTIFEPSHALQIPTISGTGYYYRITSCDIGGLCKNTAPESFIAGKLIITADIPRYPRSQQIDIPGRTRAGVTVGLTVNGQDVRKLTTNKPDFIFRAVNIRAVNNTITLTSTVGNETAQQTYLADVDNTPPLLTVTVPKLTTSSTIVANITVSEQVNVTVSTHVESIPPDAPLGLLVQEQTQSVNLSWQNVTNATEYAIYRNGTRIATTITNAYVDYSPSPGNVYEYRVSAVNGACLESPLSDAALARMPFGTARPDTVTATRLTCDQQVAPTILPAGKNTLSIPLRLGQNIVTITAIDKAGFTSKDEEKITYDNGPPQFLQTNLQQLSPTFEPSVSIKGKLSEEGSITVFINGKAVKTKTTDPDGTFSIPVQLERTIIVNGTRQPKIALESGTAFQNNIHLEAVDTVGLAAPPVEGQINYALCGEGTKVEVQLSTPMPDMLNPRLLLEGIQEIGLSFNYTYRGGYNASIDKNSVKIIKLELSPEFRKDYDNGLVQVASKPLIRSVRGAKATGDGYIQIKFNPLDDPWNLAENKNYTRPQNATTLAKEQRISYHRKGDCLVPGAGCIKLFLELEIPFTETVQKIPSLSNLPGSSSTSAETAKPEFQYQRTCINLEVPLDVPIPPKYLPKAFLKTTINLLTDVIDGIDKVLKPLQTIGTYLFYTCVAGMALSFIPIALEKYNCEWTAYSSALGGDGKFNPDVATVGKCKEEYASDNTAQSNCETCQNWKQYSKTIDRYYRQVCDRIMCQSAPSLQTYLKKHGRDTLKEVKLKNGKAEIGSDCAKWAQETGKKPDDKDKRPPRLLFTYNEIQGIYTTWLAHQTDTTEKEKSCAGLHSADKDCCGFEYMQEWSSSCGVSAIGALDTFDEIKESTCLAAQKANSNQIKGEGGAAVECHKFYNSAAGFCDKNGQETPTTIPVVKFCCEGAGAGTGKLEKLGLGNSREKFLYLLVSPKQTSIISPFGASTGEYDIKLGYVAETIEFEKTEQRKKTDDALRHTVNSKLEGIELPEDSSTIQKYFTEEKRNAYNQQGTVTEDLARSFAADLCNAAGYSPTSCITSADAKNIYVQAMSVIGDPQKEYIISPSEGLLNSVRCICIPTLLAFLKQTRTVMKLVRDCLNTILVTGDGSAGPCKAAISVYVCDALYEAFACFTSKFSSPGGKRAGEPGIGNVMGALTSAGTELSRRVESRYGETSMYKSLFVDRKLVHSVCMFAFTGTWDFDLAAIFDKAVDDIPIESYGMLSSCNRRFISFNPATTPKGLVTWNYHLALGFIAGADADLELKLACDPGLKCNPSDGFANGKCDCQRQEELVIEPEGFPTHIKKGETVQQEYFHTIQGLPGEGNKRYNRAVLTWRWKDGKQNKEHKEECTINLAGGEGSVPSGCRFDPATLSYRCEFGGATGGIVFTGATTAATHKIPQDVFALNEPVNVTLNVRQTYPQPIDQRNDKWITASVRRDGLEVWPTAPNYKSLTTDGDYTISSTDSKYFSTKPVVETSWFSKGTTPQAQQKYQLTLWNSKNPNSLAPADASTTGVNSITITPRAPATSFNQSYSFIIEVARVGTQEVFSLYGASGTSGLTADVNGMGGKLDLLPGATGRMSPTVTYDATQPATPPAPGMPAPPTLPFAKLTMSFSSASLGLQEGEKRQILVRYNTPSIADPCKDQKTVPQRFTITFTAYDSDSYGQVSDQISLDPNTDKNAQWTQDFYAVCATPADLGPLEQQALGQRTPIQKLIDLKKIIVDYQKRESDNKQYLLDRQKDSPETLIQKLILQQEKRQPELIDKISGMISQEVALVTELIPYDVEFNTITVSTPAPQFIEVRALIGAAGNAQAQLTEVQKELNTLTTAPASPQLPDAIKTQLAKAIGILNGMDATKTLVITAIDERIGTATTTPPLTPVAKLVVLRDFLKNDRTFASNVKILTVQKTVLDTELKGTDFTKYSNPDMNRAAVADLKKSSDAIKAMRDAVSPLVSPSPQGIAPDPFPDEVKKYIFILNTQKESLDQQLTKLGQVPTNATLNPKDILQTISALLTGALYSEVEIGSRPLRTDRMAAQLDNTLHAAPTTSATTTTKTIYAFKSDIKVPEGTTISQDGLTITLGQVGFTRDKNAGPDARYTNPTYGRLGIDNYGRASSLIKDSSGTWLAGVYDSTTKQWSNPSHQTFLALASVGEPIPTAVIASMLEQK